MRFTVLEEIKSTLPKSLFYNQYSQIKSNAGFWWEGKTGVPAGENLSYLNYLEVFHIQAKGNISILKVKRHSFRNKIFISNYLNSAKQFKLVTLLSKTLRKGAKNCMIIAETTLLMLSK